MDSSSGRRATPDPPQDAAVSSLTDGSVAARMVGWAMPKPSMMPRTNLEPTLLHVSSSSSSSSPSPLLVPSLLHPPPGSPYSPVSYLLPDGTLSSSPPTPSLDPLSLGHPLPL